MKTALGSPEKCCADVLYASLVQAVPDAARAAGLPKRTRQAALPVCAPESERTTQLRQQLKSIPLHHTAQRSMLTTKLQQSLTQDNANLTNLLIQQLVKPTEEGDSRTIQLVIKQLGARPARKHQKQPRVDIEGDGATSHESRRRNAHLGTIS